jgi:hypothetical protein
LDFSKREKLEGILNRMALQALRLDEDFDSIAVLKNTAKSLKGANPTRVSEGG